MLRNYPFKSNKSKMIKYLLLQLRELGLQRLDLGRFFLPEICEPGVAVIQLNLKPTDLVSQLTDLAVLRGLQVLKLFAEVKRQFLLAKGSLSRPQELKACRDKQVIIKIFGIQYQTHYHWN